MFGSLEHRKMPFSGSFLKLNMVYLKEIFSAEIWGGHGPPGCVGPGV